MLTGDAELVARARAGESDALGFLLERHRVVLYATAMAVVHDREAALDAVQEAFVTALTRLDSLHDPAAAGAWLRAVVRNHSLMYLRRHRREIPSERMEFDAAVPGPEQALDGHALRDELWAALDAMAEEERLTLMLRHFSRCGSYRAIADVTGVPVGTVRSRLNRARSRLVDALSAGDPARRDQGGLEQARRREWQSFYRDLHGAPEPRTYRDLYRRDVTVRDPNGCWRGIDDWSAEEREAIETGVRADIVGLAASRDLTVLEIDFKNPPWAPDHCPASSTFVHRLDGDRSARVDIYYH